MLYRILEAPLGEVFVDVALGFLLSEPSRGGRAGEGSSCTANLSLEDLRLPIGLGGREGGYKLCYRTSCIYSICMY